MIETGCCTPGCAFRWDLEALTAHIQQPHMIRAIRAAMQDVAVSESLSSGMDAISIDKVEFALIAAAQGLTIQHLRENPTHKLELTWREMPETSG